MRSLKLVASAVLLALTVACAPGNRTAPSPPASLGTVPSDWATLKDPTYGFSLRYPRGWTEEFDQPAGFHALASRADLTNLLELQGNDYWLVAQADMRDPSAGCGEPSQGPVDRAATTLDGQPATRYVITGTRGDTTQHIVDVIALRGGNCFTLQLVAGGAIPLDRELSTLQEIQASYRFGGG